MARRLTPNELARWAALGARRDALLDAMGEAHMALMAAREELWDALATAREADKQGELVRAEGEYEAAEAALSEWLTSPDGAEWDLLDTARGVAL